MFHQYFADPFVLQAEGGYYAFGTGQSGGGSQFLVLRSSDLMAWHAIGFALKTPPGMEGMAFWAPEVVERSGEFHMYYSCGEEDRGHRIRLAVASRPAGPYQDVAAVTPPQLPFAIDPHVHTSETGECYLFYASDRLAGSRPGTCLFVDRMLAPDKLAGEPRLVAEATADWQRFERDREIYGATYDWHTLEGPCTVWNDGLLYVLYSGGNWQNDSYGVDFVVAEHPLGPYRNETKDRPRTMGTVPGAVLGPGHNSVTMAPDGRRMIVYHAWDPERTGRYMRIDPLLFTESGPIVDGPTWSAKT